MKKMKKLINQIIGSFLLLIFLSNCSSVKDALSYTKKPSGDEFLVKKKDPLTMPPEFNILAFSASITISPKGMPKTDLPDPFPIPFLSIAIIQTGLL